MTSSLGQVVGREAAARAEAGRRTGKVFKEIQKPQLFEGFSRVYAPFSENEDEARTGIRRLPPEGRQVQYNAEDMLLEFLGEYSAAIDLAAAKDYANCTAFADVKVGERVVLSRVPATHLLHMEKVLDDWAKFVASLPVLDQAETWKIDPDTGLRKTAESFTIRTEVKKAPLVLHVPTAQHPAQVAVIDESVNVGKWTQVKFSGAMTPERKRLLSARVTELRTAFKAAREEANQAEARSREEAQSLIDYLLG